MTPWDNLLAALDAALGFPTRNNSTARKLKQGYDNETNEHVIWIEYRVRVNPGNQKQQGPRPGSMLEALTR